MCDKNKFQEVYPFATEAISSYFPNLNLKDKSLLTVGSSLDQAFNGLVLGVKNVTVFDINKNTLEFYKLKRNLILTTPREELYSKVLDLNIPKTKDIFSEDIIKNINLYLKDDNSYELLRNRLQNDNIKFINGDIFNLDNSLENQKYDRIILSNILQYIESFSKKEDINNKLKTSFNKLSEHLNYDGIMQFLYLYTFSKENIENIENPLMTYDLKRVYNTLKTKNLDIHFFEGICSKNRTDAIVTYTKKR